MPWPMKTNVNFEMRAIRRNDLMELEMPPEQTKGTDRVSS